VKTHVPNLLGLEKYLVEIYFTGGSLIVQLSCLTFFPITRNLVAALIYGFHVLHYGHEMSYLIFPSLIVWFLSCSVTKNSMYQLMQPQIDIIIFEIIFPLMCFVDNDQKLWDEDPHEYVRKGYGKSALALYFCLGELVIITCPLFVSQFSSLI
jgi:hypothetical protein